MYPLDVKPTLNTTPTIENLHSPPPPHLHISMFQMYVTFSQKKHLLCMKKMLSNSADSRTHYALLFFVKQKLLSRPLAYPINFALIEPF